MKTRPLSPVAAALAARYNPQHPEEAAPHVIESRPASATIRPLPVTPETNASTAPKAPAVSPAQSIEPTHPDERE